VQQIIGQQQAIDTLLTSLASGRMHHAWVFSGPRGVGKFTAAVEVARILLDPTAESDLAGRPVANPSSKSSQRIDAESHPDLHIVRKELALYSDNRSLNRKKLTNIPLDLIRELVIGGRTSDDRMHEPPAYRTAALNHGKVFIIDEAELLAREAQNSILKTLEEPPPHTYFFLITDQHDMLLPTVRSRCQHVRFRLLDEKSMSEWFKRAQLDVGKDELEWIRNFADGSPGQAQLAAEYKLYEWQLILEPLVHALDRGQPATELGATLGELVERFAQAWVKAHANASKEAANRDGTAKLLFLLASMARRRAADAVAKGTQSEPWLQLIDAIAFTEREIDANVNMKLALESLAVQWGELVTAKS
jgi:DNA polymerase-3 subunit delta'